MPSYLARWSSAYCSIHPWPAESTNLSRSNQAGFLGLKRRNSSKRTWPSGGQPMGRPGCPDCAFSTASMDRNPIVFTDRFTSSGAAGCEARTRAVAVRPPSLLPTTLAARRARVDVAQRRWIPRHETAAVLAVDTGVVEVDAAIAASERGEAPLDARRVLTVFTGRRRGECVVLSSRWLETWTVGTAK
jgi:hypothetical protein